MGGPVHTLSSFGSSNCVLTGIGGVRCWGSNVNGELGDGTLENRAAPIDVPGLGSGVLSVAAGGSHGCAVLPGGGVRCWGTNNFFQLGNQGPVQQLTPVTVERVGEPMATLAAGSVHTCGISATNRAKCWGAQGEGQLGLGFIDADLVTVAAPLDVARLSAAFVRAIAAGTSHTCALLATGEVRCWGRNSAGQLGDGTGVRRASPVVPIGLGSGVVAIAASHEHTCALLAGGGVKCWGGNDQGQLGNDSRHPSLAPVDVIGIEGATAIATGG